LCEILTRINVLTVFLTYEKNMSISSITSSIPSVVSPLQVVRNANTLAILAIGVLAVLPTAYAGACQETEKICIKACHEFHDGTQAGACLIGCKLAYWACHFFMKGKG
jgi:hypothetical protein